MALLLGLIVCCYVGLSSAVLPDNFVGMTAKQKQDVFWTNLNSDKYTSNPMPRSVVNDDALYNSTFLEGAFGQEIEEMQPGREKIVGTNGINAKADFIVNAASPYTGMWKAGATNIGIMRLSSNTAANLLHFFAMKMFVDYNNSQHLHMIHDVVGFDIEAPDFFTWPMQTQVPAPLPADYASGRYSSKVDDSFNGCIKALPGGPLHRPPNAWGLGNVEQAEIDNQNNKPAKVIAPYIVQITPNPAIRPVTVRIHTDDWRAVVMSKIPANTKLYTVQAMKSPCDPYVELGEIWTRSELVASHYGDKVIKFSQPYTKWDYSVAAPGVYCTKDPDALPMWSAEEAQAIEDFAVGVDPPSIAYGNSDAAIAGKVRAAGLQ